MFFLKVVPKKIMPILKYMLETIFFNCSIKIIPSHHHRFWNKKTLFTELFLHVRKKKKVACAKSGLKGAYEMHSPCTIVALHSACCFQKWSSEIDVALKNLQ